MARSKEGKWIENLIKPYRKVVDEANVPPLPLESLAKSVARDQDGLRTLYEELIQVERQFEDLPDDLNPEDVQFFFDEHPFRDRPLTPTEQHEKWIDYPKLRIIAAWKKMVGDLPTIKPFSEDWGWGIPKEEVNLILLLDAGASLDSQDPEQIAIELRRNDELKEFLDKVYRENRTLRRKIMELDRPGVKFGLLEAYEERIGILDEIYTTEIQYVGMDIVHDRLMAAEQEIRAARNDVEDDVHEVLSTEIKPRLASIENTLVDVENSDDVGEVTDIVDQQLWELRHDLQKWSLTEATNLEADLAKLNDLRHDIKRSLADERMEASEALIDIQKQLDEMNAQVAKLAGNIDEEIQKVYPIVADTLTGEAYTDDKPVLEELAQLLWLYIQVNDESSDCR